MLKQDEARAVLLAVLEQIDRADEVVLDELRVLLVRPSTPPARWGWPPHR